MPPLPRQAATTALLPLPLPNCCHRQHTAATHHRRRAAAAAAANNLPPRLQPSCHHHCSAAKLMGVLKCHQLIAIPITTRNKKRCSRLSVVTPFQLQLEKKDTVVWPSFVAPFRLPLLRRSNYDRKKRYSHLSVVTPFQLRPEKKDTVVWPSFAVPFQLPLLVVPFQL